MISIADERPAAAAWPDAALHGAVGDFLGGVAAGIAIAELICRLLF